MADKKISELDSATTLSGTEQIPAVQSAANVKLTPAQIETYLALGDAAKKDTGTTTGTVAAGDHNHDSDYADISHDHDSDYADIDAVKKLVGINEQTGTTYTLVLTDAGKLVRCSNAAAITLTIPKNSSVAFATGTRILVEQQGAGVVTVAPVDGDVTINSTAKKTWGQYSVIELIKLGTDLWNVVGGSV